MKTFYDILKISENASIDEIEQSYLNLKENCEKLLLVPEKKERANEYLKKMEVAYKVLSNPQTKSSYDQDLINMRNNELMNNLQKNTYEHNRELKEQEELKIQLENDEIERKKKQKLEEEKNKKNEAIQAAIQKQIQIQVEEQEKQKQQRELEEENRKKLEKKITKEYKKYIRKNKKFSIGRIFFAIVIVFVIVFLISRIPIVKNYYMELYNNFLNIFE